MKTALAVVPAAVILLTGCASGSGADTPSPSGTVAAVDAVTAPGTTSSSTTAPTPTSASATAADVPTAIPTTFTDVNQTITDPDLKDSITVKRVARALPWRLDLVGRPRVLGKSPNPVMARGASIQGPHARRIRQRNRVDRDVNLVQHDVVAQAPNRVWIRLERVNSSAAPCASDRHETNVGADVHDGHARRDVVAQELMDRLECPVIDHVLIHVVVRPAVDVDTWLGQHRPVAK